MRKQTHTHIYTHKQHFKNMSEYFTSAYIMTQRTSENDYNKTHARSMYKQYTQYSILHLKASACDTKNCKNTIQ